MVVSKVQGAEHEMLNEQKEITGGEDAKCWLRSFGLDRTSEGRFWRGVLRDAFCVFVTASIESLSAQVSFKTLSQFAVDDVLGTVLVLKMDMVDTH